MIGPWMHTGNQNEWRWATRNQGGVSGLLLVLPRLPFFPFFLRIRGLAKGSALTAALAA